LVSLVVRTQFRNYDQRKISSTCKKHRTINDALRATERSRYFTRNFMIYFVLLSYYSV